MLGFELRAREGPTVVARREVIWVTSTLPESGKTQVAAGLVQALVRAGRSAVGMKPIELAATYGEDHDLLSVDANLLGTMSPIPVPPLVRAPYRFASRCSPALAASQLGIELTLDDLAATVQGAAVYGTPVVVDSPGAAFSALLPGSFGLDLAQHVAATIVLVVPEVQGGDALAHSVLEGCRRRNLTVAGVVTTQNRWSAADLVHFLDLAATPLLVRAPEPRPEAWDGAARRVLDVLLG